MKIVFFGYDFFASAAERIVEDQHQIVEYFSIETDNVYDFNSKIKSLAERTRAPVLFHPPTTADLERWRCSDVDLLFSMAYPRRVPVCADIKGVNLHPTLLPMGRGRWPIPWLLLKYPEASGLTLHRHTREWDAGDILDQIRLSVTPDDTIESLSARLQMAAVDFVSSALSNFPRLWAAARPQAEEASHWPMPADEDRLLRWDQGVTAVLKVVRAFGKFESIAQLDSGEWMVTDAQGWVTKHSHQPGTVVHRLGTEVIVAAVDGYVLLRHLYRERDLSCP